MVKVANNVVATPVARTIANTHKYSAAPKAVPCANVQYMLTKVGAATAASGGLGKSGKPTCMALVAVAAAKAGATTSQPVSGMAIVLAMRTMPAIKAAYAATKAGKYAPKGALPCHAWVSGYVTGAARSDAGLLASK